MHRGYADSIADHYEGCWARSVGRMRLMEGPHDDLPTDFNVLVLPRAGTIAHATVCMSQPEDDERLELHTLTRGESNAVPEIVELLTAIAHYHRTGRRLGLGHTVNVGRPWVPGSNCTRGLVSLPYLDGPTLEWSTEPRVRFLWLVPVTEEEVELKMQRGLEALEQRFENAGCDLLDLTRRSVAVRGT